MQPVDSIVHCSFFLPLDDWSLLYVVLYAVIMQMSELMHVAAHTKKGDALIGCNGINLLSIMFKLLFCGLAKLSLADFDTEYGVALPSPNPS